MDNQDQVRDSRQPGHFWADNEIVDEYLSTIGIYGFAVYMLLTRYADFKTGQCDPSVSGMATRLGISAPTVRAALDKLKDAKLITIRHRHREKDGKMINQTSVYTILAIKKAQTTIPTKPHLVPNVVDQGVLNQVDQGTKGDLVGVLNQVSTNKTHENKTQLTRESGQSAKPLDDLSRALFNLCLLEPDSASKADITAMRKTYRALADKCATIEQVAGQFTEYWYSDSNWRTRKAHEGGYTPEPPKPDHVLTEWQKAMAWKPAKQQTANGPRTISAPAFTPVPKDELATPEDIAAARARRSARAIEGK